MIAVALSVGAGIWLLASRPVDPPRIPAINPPTTGHPAQTAAAPLPVPPPVTPPQSPPSAASAAPTQAPLIADRETAKQQLRAWAATFDAAALPSILPYLEHPEAEVRMAAASALVMLGDGAAAPALLTAAEKASGRQAEVEATTFNEAADLLSRPTGIHMPAVPATNRQVTQNTWDPAARAGAPKTSAPADAPVSR